MDILEDVSIHGLNPTLTSNESLSEIILDVEQSDGELEMGNYGSVNLESNATTFLVPVEGFHSSPGSIDIPVLSTREIPESTKSGRGPYVWMSFTVIFIILVIFAPSRSGIPSTIRLFGLLLLYAGLYYAVWCLSNTNSGEEKQIELKRLYKYGIGTKKKVWLL